MTTLGIPLGNTPKKGTDIHLVRWAQTDDGWRPETVLATYVASTSDEWIVNQAGQQRRLPRDQWLQFAMWI
jgi:hypothetical protein